MVNSKRKKQINEQVQRELANIILHIDSEPLLTKVTIISAEVSPDLAVAKVFFSVFDNTNIAETTKLLQLKAKEIRHALAKNLNLRITPRLNFFYDDSLVKAQKLMALIDQAVASDQSKLNSRSTTDDDESTK